MPTVLIVDDSLSVRKVAERLLTEAGLEVALAANGEEAITWMNTKRPDLVIADVIMPDKSGFEVCTFIKSHATLANTPVLLVSGFVDDEVTKQAEACRADGIIKKPFQGASLRERVLGLLSARTEQAPVSVPMPVPEVPKPKEEEFKPAIPSAAPAAPAPAQLQALEARLQAFQESVTHALADLGKQLQALHESAAQAKGPIQALEARFAKQEGSIAQFEQKMQSFRESTAQALTQVHALEPRLVEEERQSATLREQLAGLGPARESMAQALTDLGKQLQDLRDSTSRTAGPVQMLQSRIAEQENRLALVEQKVQSVHESNAHTLTQVQQLEARVAGLAPIGEQATQALTQVQQLEARLAEAEKHSASLRERLTALEPIVASAEKLVQTLASFTSHSAKPGEGKDR